jgi:tRNA-splicing ligase RtcB
MGTPGYVVRGRGCRAALHSASHGAGRKMSRTKALRTFTWEEARAFLTERKVHLISGGLDEIPMAYKDIETVMAAQGDLVTPLARFDPRLVKMAPPQRRGRRR